MNDVRMNISTVFITISFITLKKTIIVFISHFYLDDQSLFQKKVISYNHFFYLQLDDAALQVFKDGDYGPYLDLESTICEQEEDLEGLQDR